jgi:D-sedoheptulose 7-phosphate isomerase
MGIDTILEMINDAKKNGRFVFICGNGGSASTAEHFANDLFSCGVKTNCLNSNLSLITMIANDYGYEYIFRKQLELYANPEDLLIIFSCSGASSNVLLALGFCKTIAFTGMWGFYGGVDYVMRVESDDCGVIENEHLSIAHKVSDGICMT